MASTAHPEASTTHPEATTSTTPTAEETLDELLRDAPRNAEARARQEAAWDLQGKEDARRLLYEREVAARHAKLLAASINAFWRAEVVAQGHGQGCIPLPKETVALIGEFAEPSAHLVVTEAINRREGGAARPASRLARRRPGWRVRTPRGRRRRRTRAKSGATAASRSTRGIKPMAMNCASSSARSGDAVVLHEAKLSRSHRTFACRHHRVQVDGVFESDACEVMEKVVDPLIDDVKQGRGGDIVTFRADGHRKDPHSERSIDALRSAA